MAIRIFNTLSGRKEEFTPISGDSVNMYACGITVSGEAHIGHAYQALIYDIIRKYLEKRGYKVTYARNYTDVDDKIIAKSNETGIPADEYAAEIGECEHCGKPYYIADYYAELEELPEGETEVKCTDCEQPLTGKPLN